VSCELFVYDESKGTSSRPKLFNSTAILWAKEKEKSFLTFTLPSIENGVYQRDAGCPYSGDITIASYFSKVMESYSLRLKRRNGKLSYVWVAEAQSKRQKKYGGVGDIHYHVVVNQKLKDNLGRVCDSETLNWLQDLWCSHVGASSKNCLDVQPLPDDISSVPAYLSKYLGKGSQRMILSRQFGASRDLTRFKPITLQTLPEADLITQYDYTTPTGYESCVRYFDTRQVLELYGSDMAYEGRLNSSRMDKNFTQDKIVERAFMRQQCTLGLSYST